MEGAENNDLSRTEEKEASIASSVLTFDQAASLYEWGHIYSGADFEGNLKSWEDIEHDFRHDEFVTQMNSWERTMLSEDEFWNLVYCQTQQTAEVLHEGDDRRLRQVAARFNDLDGEVNSSYLKSSLVFLPKTSSVEYIDPIFLRETIGESEQKDQGSYYIHDGNRRMLAYASRLIKSGEDYVPIPVVIGRKKEVSEDEADHALKPLLVKGFGEREPVPGDEVQNTFRNADQIYFVFPDKIGDAVHATGFLKSVCAAETAMGLESKRKVALVPLSLHGLFLPLCKKYGVSLHQSYAGSGGSTNRAQFEAQESDKKTMVFELDAIGGDPDLRGLYFGEGQLTIRNMFESMIGRYKLKDSGPNRQRRFVADLLGADALSIAPLDVQPGFEFEDGSASVKKRFEKKYNINTSRPQVAINIETSEPGRQYSLENWVEVVELIRDVYPDVELSIIYDPSKDERDETYINRDVINGRFKELVRGEGGNVVRIVNERLVDLIGFLRTQDIFISNDTGVPHLAATSSYEDMPNVVSIFAAPEADPDVWVSSPRMKPVVPDASVVSRSKFGGIYCTNPDQKWVNMISPKAVAGTALANWRQDF